MMPIARSGMPVHPDPQPDPLELPGSGARAVYRLRRAVPRPSRIATDAYCRSRRASSIAITSLSWSNKSAIEWIIVPASRAAQHRAIRTAHAVACTLPAA
jgi:hypothetical protein